MIWAHHFLSIDSIRSYMLQSVAKGGKRDSCSIFPFLFKTLHVIANVFSVSCRSQPVMSSLFITGIIQGGNSHHRWTLKSGWSRDLKNSYITSDTKIVQFYNKI